MKTVFATCVAVGLAEWLIDKTCLVIFYFLKDDVVLQRLVTFEEDDTDSKPLPPTIKLMSVEVPGLEQLVLEFVKKYYQCYDMDSRQPLLDAYHEHAMMSMSAFSSSGKGLVLI